MGTVGVDEAIKCIEIIRCYSIIHDLIISSNVTFEQPDPGVLTFVPV